MKKFMTILLVLTCVTLTGCNKYWYQESKTFDECELAQKQCFGELLKRSDIQYVTDYEVEFMKQCMQDKGYRLVEESKLPLDAKRRNPEKSFDWRANGIAGSLK
ncbi:MAG: hypothetical protein ACYTET_01725 [Planctomycetota bacterium]|jgi:hypothetical protein